jgi:UPF0755 protein
MRPVRRVLWLAATVLLAAVAGAGAASLMTYRALNGPLSVPADGLLFEIPSGSALGTVTARLRQRGVLEHPRLLTWYARLRGDATRIHAGEYQLSPGMTALSLLRALVAGDVYLHQLTIVEGWRFADLLAALRADPAVDADGAGGEEIMAALGEPGVHPEGQFLPDTYRFEKGTSELELLRLAHSALEKKLADAWAHRASGVQLESPYDALILASIIEKETALPSEREMISGVLQRRLQRGMRLQTDPTVIYGLGDAFDGNLRRRDLADDTPYNTYTRRGLPPTPIALPSAASIDAAVTPEPGDALYFVATGRGDGSHHFSATLEEHNEAVRAFLRQSRQNDEAD